MKARLRFELLSYWHAGTGRGNGDLADAVVQRSDAGLPYLPGRTVKGLVRSAADIGVDAGLLTREEAEAWFGTRLIAEGRDRVERLEQARFRTRPGTLRFGSATLGPAWEAWARGAKNEPKKLAPLFTLLASTAIDEERGVASDRTLRTFEVAVPVTLEASVEGPEGRWPDVLVQIAPFLRAIGSGRNRGLGRVRLTVKVPQ